MVGRDGRQAVVEALLRGLRARPIIPRPAATAAECHDSLLARIDTPGCSAVLGEDQYAALNRGTSVIWRGVLSFIARADTSSDLRVFWLDPIRFAILGCRLTGGEARLIMPALNGVAYSAAAVTQCEPGLSSDHYCDGARGATAESVGGATYGPGHKQAQVLSPGERIMEA